jgi:hypothetical protein
MEIFAKYAPRYAQAGFLVFPLAAGSKIPPKGSNGLLDATTDPDKIAWWSAHMPDANLAVRTGEVSGITVIDIDITHYGFETDAALRKQGKCLPTGAIARTRSGGRHIWCRYSPRARTGQNRLGHGIDIRNDGGYVVAPPSIVEGGKYSWLTWPKTELPPVPQWVGDYLEEEQRAKEALLLPARAVNMADVNGAAKRRYEGFAHAALQAEAASLASQPKPGRNDALFRKTCLLGKYVAHGILNPTRLTNCLFSACQSNGLVRDNGSKDVIKTIEAGLKFSHSDPLPVLAERERRTA